MNHERMFNHLSNQFLEHLSHAEDELGFRLDKNMMHIPGTRKPLVYRNLTFILRNSPSDPERSYSRLNMSGTAVRESGPGGFFSAARESKLNQPSAVKKVDPILGTVPINPDRMREGDFPRGEEGFGERMLRMSTMADVQREMVDSPDLANWSDLPDEDSFQTRKRLVDEGEPVMGVSLRPDGIFDRRNVSYEADFDPASRELINPMIVQDSDAKNKRPL